LALTNMPIQRFGSTLVSKGQLRRLHGPAAREAFSRSQSWHGVMCRNLVSVDWQGWLYDCDFNQQLDLPLGIQRPRCVRHLRDLLQDRPARRSRFRVVRPLLRLHRRAGQQLRRCAGALSGRARRSHGDDAARARVVAGHRHARSQ
jgi:hypothetical protein